VIISPWDDPELKVDISDHPVLVRLVEVAEHIDYELHRFCGYDTFPCVTVEEKSKAHQIAESNINYNFQKNLKLFCSERRKSQPILLPNNIGVKEIGPGVVWRHVEGTLRKAGNRAAENCPAFVEMGQRGNVLRAVELYLAGLHDSDPFRALEEAVLKRYLLLRWEGGIEGPIERVILYAQKSEGAE
jgi:hypothetical protein